MGVVDIEISSVAEAEAVARHCRVRRRTQQIDAVRAGYHGHDACMICAAAEKIYPISAVAKLQTMDVHAGLIVVPYQVAEKGSSLCPILAA